MKILVINGDCIQTNSSANLCHLAYIRGLLSAGHDVTLLSADGRDYTLDPSMTIPAEVRQYTYYGVSLYEKLALRKKKAAPAPVEEEEVVDILDAQTFRNLVELRNALQEKGIDVSQITNVKAAENIAKKNGYNYTVEKNA